jgi:hypothetical protein
VGTENTSMTRKTAAEPRCSNGTNCVAYSALGEPSKLSRGNPGPRCFACEERRASSTLKRAVAKETKGTGSQEANEPRRDKSNRLKEHVGKKHAEVGGSYVVLERRRKSVLTCERGLRSALASGDERLVRRWSRALRDAETRLAWTEADFERSRSATG